MIRSYISLTKPGILLGNTITAAGGFALVSKGKIDLGLLLATLAGLGLIMAAGCVLNNYIDRMADAKMQRTKNRPLARGEIALNHAFFFGLFLCITGAAILVFFTNVMTLLIALCGFVIYVGIYTLAKYRTHHATLIGSFAGAAPPLVGCTAASFALDPAALLLFSTVALWQMPHFFAIGIYRMHEYEVAQIPILPIKRGLHNTKIQIFFYIIAFMVAAASLTFFGYTGKIFLSAALLLSATWLLLALIGFKAEKEKLWARRMFLFSLVVITTLSALLFVDTVT
jgi:protoheme IX farnesyltransferase